MGWFTHHKYISFGIVVAAAVVLVWLMRSTPSAMVPNEDTGVVFAMVDVAAGAVLHLDFETVGGGVA